MSEQAPERGPEDGRGQQRRPAPSGYGRRQSDAGSAHGLSADSHAGSMPVVDRPSPYYGRVTRFGTAEAEPGARHAAPRPPVVGPPGVASPTSWPAPSGAAYPLAPPSGEQQTLAPPPWTAPPPGWTAVPIAPSWRREEYATWSRRVAGNLLDHVPSYVALALLLVSYAPLYAGLLHRDVTAQPSWPLFVVGLLLCLAATGWNVYNRWVVAGRTGQSLGRRVTRTWLVSSVDGRPVGVLNALVRDLLHVLDGLGYVGYLWPLWDDQRQTLADKIIQTVVVRTPVAPLTDLERSSRP